MSCGESGATKFAPELGQFLESEWTLAPTVDEAFDAAGIVDVELRMMFSCIHPALTEETQVALVLNLLCGFGVDETAAAFLKNAGAMEQRLSRAKKTLAESKELFNLSGPADVATRLSAVLRALYLLFNEGYHGASSESSIRVKLCAEALRLALLLLQNRFTATPAAHVLAALFHFLAARLPGRVDADGNLLALFEQDRSHWDRALIAEGRRQLELSAAGEELTAYHVEAAIAELHADADCVEHTDWDAIAALYDTLMKIAPTPVVALNRAVALAHRDGPARGLEEIKRIEDIERLAGYPFYLAAIAEFELRLGHTAQSRESFRAAIELARNSDERRFLQARLNACRRVSQ
jgi:predicted RNA polymerase sigma factor